MNAPYFKKQLSSRELEVLQLSAQGMTDKEIAQRLDVSLGTIHTYWTRIRAKCQGKTRAEIVGKHVRSTMLSDSGQAGVDPSQSPAAKVVAALPHATLRFDAEFNIEFANDAACRLYGRTPSELIGKNLNELNLPPRVVHRATAIVEKMRSTSEHTILTIDGYQMNAVPQFRADESLEGIVLTYVQLSIDPELVSPPAMLR